MRLISLLGACWLLGCSAAGEGSPASGQAGGSGGAGNPPSNGTTGVGSGVGPSVIGACMPGAKSSGPAPLRRISGAEYGNAVRDLFGASVNLGDLPADELVGTFVTNVSSPVETDSLSRYLLLSRKVAEDVFANFTSRSGCTDVSDRACVEAFLVARARRAFHGVLEDADKAQLLSLYGSLLTSTDAPTALETAVRFLLVSPRFLYLVDFGQPAEPARSRLTPSEVAGRLAAFLWRSVPDDALLAAADTGALETPEQVRAQASRMLDDGRASEALRQFIDQMLGISLGAGSTDLDRYMAAEAGDFFARAARSDTGTFGDLLTSRAAPQAAELAQFYGAVGAELPLERAGLLTRAGFLRSHASGLRPSPIKRGHGVRKAFLCDAVPPAPKGLNVSVPDISPGQSERDAFGAHSSNPVCWSCHQWMDPLGHSFDAFDGAGSFTSADVDSSSAIYPSSAVALPKTDLASRDELIAYLANSEFSQQCFTIQLSRFGLGRPEAAADACGLKEVWDAFSASSLNLRQLFLGLVSSSHFLYRYPVQPGGACQ